MGLNIILFGFSAYIIFFATKAGSKMSSCTPQTNFNVYLRLAVIMGMTWINGLAAGFVDCEPIWYVFVVLNALQGLFIFMAFTCNKRVLSSLRDRSSCARFSENDNTSKPTLLSEIDVTLTSTYNENFQRSPGAIIKHKNSGLEPRDSTKNPAHSKLMYQTIKTSAAVVKKAFAKETLEANS